VRKEKEKKNSWREELRRGSVVTASLSFSYFYGRFIKSFKLRDQSAIKESLQIQFLINNVGINFVIKNDKILVVKEHYRKTNCYRF